MGWLLTCSWHTSEAVKVDSFVCYSLQFAFDVLFRSACYLSKWFSWADYRLSISIVFICVISACPWWIHRNVGVRVTVLRWRVTHTDNQHAHCLLDTQNTYMTSDLHLPAARLGAVTDASLNDRHIERTTQRWPLSYVNANKCFQNIYHPLLLLPGHIVILFLAVASFANDRTIASSCANSNVPCQNNTAIGHMKAAMSSATLKPFTYSQPSSGRSKTARTN